MPVLVKKVWCLELSEDNTAIAGDVVFLYVEEQTIATKLVTRNENNFVLILS